MSLGFEINEDCLTWSVGDEIDEGCLTRPVSDEVMMEASLGQLVMK